MGRYYDEDYHHRSIQIKIDHETDKAFLAEKNNKFFWIPKSLLRHIRRKGDMIEAKLWTGFKPEYLETVEDIGMTPLVKAPESPPIGDDPKFISLKKGECLDIPMKHIKKKGEAQKVELYDEEWARNEGLL